MAKFEGGISINVLNRLKNKCDVMIERDKKCILLMDEMAIKKELEYNTAYDLIHGYHDFGELGRSICIYAART